jgi:hypothetical protein
MAIYRVRLEDPDSDEFRLVAVAANTQAEARAICEAQEQRYVGFTIAREETAADRPQVWDDDAEEYVPDPDWSPGVVGDPKYLARLEKLDQQDADRAEGEPAQLRGRDKARLCSHRQLKPYKIVKVERA